MDHSLGNYKSIGVSRKCIKLKGLIPGSPVLIPSQINPVHTRIPSFLTMRLNIITPHINIPPLLPKYCSFFCSGFPINPLDAELNPIHHLLILLGDLTFMGTCIVSIFQYISNKLQRYTIYLYLETALHVSGGTSTHHQ
jgi:hypothetical protein